MERIICLNGTMVNSGNSSSPVPFIGLYVATGNLVCLLLMGFDILAGFRSRNLWFPCKFFSLNSITLALLSVSTKIPVDLTSQMPSVQDQLSKLTGTVFICLAMSFMICSIGNNGEFESYANITSLTIFVITVLVNICTQMATRIISCFFCRTFVVLCCMIILLIRFWFSVVLINAHKLDTADRNKDLVKMDEISILSRLKLCYLHGYNSCPQFFLSCKIPSSSHVGLVCTVCVLILSEAMIRSLFFNDLKFCGGVSDYGWSMWLMVTTQILAILIASVAVGLRWRTSRHPDNKYNFIMTKPYLQFLSLFSLTEFPKFLEICFRYLVCYPHLLIDLLFKGLSMKKLRIISTVMGRNWRYNFTDERDMEEGNGTEFGLPHWILDKCVAERQRWMDVNAMTSPKHLMGLLNAIHPSEISLTSDFNRPYSLSSLSLLLLVDMAKLFTPASENIALTVILNEIFETIHFIDNKVNVGSSKNRLRSMYANVLWKFRFTDSIVNIKLLQEIIDEMVKAPFESETVLVIISKFADVYYDPIVKKEADEIVKFMHHRSYASSKEVFDHIQQLFVDMLAPLFCSSSRSHFQSHS